VFPAPAPPALPVVFVVPPEAVPPAPTGLAFNVPPPPPLAARVVLDAA